VRAAQEALATLAEALESSIQAANNERANNEGTTKLDLHRCSTTPRQRSRQRWWSALLLIINLASQLPTSIIDTNAQYCRSTIPYNDGRGRL